MLTLDLYQDSAASTALYPDRGSNPSYPALGLAGEAGEVAEKLLAGESGSLLAAEIGDTLWYAAALAAEAGLTLSEVVLELIEPGEPELDATTALTTLTFEQLQRAALAEAPHHAEDPLRAALALSVAAGRVCERVKKIIRDEAGVITPARREGLSTELAGFLRAAAILASALDAELGELAQDNLDKLAARAAASTLQGEGDTIRTR